MTDWKPDICIYHGGCDDGFGAAWAVWRHWPGIEFVPGIYGKPLPDVTDKDVLFVDFSAKRDALDAMANQARSIVILDHHKTAQADLEPFAVAVDGGPANLMPLIGHMLRDLAELNRPPVIAYFDMDESGAALAWQFVTQEDRQEHPMPEIISLIEDRDLWRFAYGDKTRQFSAALRTHPQDFDCWDVLARSVADMISEGAVVLRAHQHNVSQIAREAYLTEVGGVSIPVVNAPYHYSSDVAHELLKLYPDAPFVGAWFHRADGFIQWSLRSEDGRADVSEVAKAKGGGGHRNAAGFQEAA